MIRMKLLASTVLSVVFIGMVKGESMNLSIVTGLLSEQPLERQVTYKKILEQRTKTIEELLLILKIKNIDKSYEGTLHRTIKLLGKLRAEEAVQPLLEYFMYVPEGFETDEMIPTEAYYVAAVALIEIGEPSIPFMLLKIKQTDSKEEQKLAGWVIMQIEGKEQALHRMEDTIKTEDGQKDRFMEAKTYIEKYKATFDNPLLKSRK